jgi:hypothetical protein
LNGRVPELVHEVELGPNNLIGSCVNVFHWLLC